MKKIAFFLYNTSMCSYGLCKQYPFLKEDFAIFLFHIDSLTQDRSIKLKFKSNFTNYDISSLNTNQIIKLIKKLSIDVFVFYSFQSSFDKLLLKICKYLKIPTILHDHGIVFGKTVGKGKLHISRHLIKRFFLAYLRSHEADKTMKNIKVNNDGYDHYLIYSKFNKNYYKNFFILNKANTTIGGLPLFESEKDSSLLLTRKKQQKILYIHQPFTKFGFSSIKNTQEIIFINEINLAAKKNNLKLEIRLHPAELDSYLLSHRWDPNICFNNNLNLDEQCASSNIILGHWSTALAIALPLSIPLIIIEYPKIRNEFIKYYSIFNGVGYYIKNTDELVNKINEIINIKKFSYNSEDKSFLIGEENTFQSNCMYLKNIINKNLLGYSKK